MRSILIAILMIAAAAGPLFAQSGDRGTRERSESRKQMEELNLTEQQKDVMRDVCVATKMKMIDLRADLKKKRLELREIMREDTPHRAAFERIAREITDLQLRQKLLLFDSRQEVMKLLDAEQQKLFREMQHHRRMMHGERIMMRGERMKGCMHRPDRVR